MPLLAFMDSPGGAGWVVLAEGHMIEGDIQEKSVPSSPFTPGLWSLESHSNSPPSPWNGLLSAVITPSCLPQTPQFL